jgi:DNA adenine methylase
LKWAGGKRWLLPVIQDVWTKHQECRLVEPFAGGMAVALGLNPAKALLNDRNDHLINFYKQVSKGLTISPELRNNATYYYKQRQKFNELILTNQHNSAQAAALFYYLMRTGFNGLCRFNSSGTYNVPFGQHNTINYRQEFAEYQPIFKRWQFKNTDFAKLKLLPGDFVYADPPYDVEFTRYSREDFTWDDQLRLANWLIKHDGPVIASNQATPRILELYQDLKFTVYTLPAPRMISCNGDRSNALEILATNNVLFS